MQCELGAMCTYITCVTYRREKNFAMHLQTITVPSEDKCFGCISIF